MSSPELDALQAALRRGVAPLAIWSQRHFREPVMWGESRLGHAMTNTEALTHRNRPSGTNNLFVAWETLTHGDNPA